MDNNFAFRKTNYIILAVGVAIILVGYILMGGAGSDEQHFNPDIFSATRIRLAPVVCILGFIVSGVGVMWHKNDKKA